MTQHKQELSVLLLPGDHIGAEVTAQAVTVLQTACDKYNISLSMQSDLIGGASIEQHGVPITDACIAKAKTFDAVLLGAVGGPEWDGAPRESKPESGLLKIRSELALFANIRPSFNWQSLSHLSPLKSLQDAALDLVIVRELTGGIYFGEPRASEVLQTSQGPVRRAYNTMVYDEHEIARIAHIAFQIAQKRDKKVTSIDKANVLEVSELWRTVVTEVAKDYTDVQLEHLYVDNAAMQLVIAPQQFDVVLAPNLFGDILSDLASVLPGSIGVLPSASLSSSAVYGAGSDSSATSAGANRQATSVALYEPCHGSAPDIAGQGIANPAAAILSVAMMLEFSAGHQVAAQAVRDAVASAMQAGYLGRDLGGDCTTTEITQAIVARLIEQ